MGIRDNLEFAFFCSEAAAVECSLLDDAGNAVAASQSYSVQANESISYTWNGTDASGYAADGFYKVAIAATDSYGNRGEKEIQVVVDNNKEEHTVGGLQVWQGDKRIVHDYRAGHQLDHEIEALETGYLITWISANPGSSVYDVYARKLNKNDNRFEPVFMVNTEIVASQFQPKSANTEQGFVITWVSDMQDGDRSGIYAQRDNDNNPVGSEFQVNTETSDCQYDPAIVKIDNGFVITWQSRNQDGDNYGVYGQRFDTNGNKVNSEFRVNTETVSSQTMLDIISIDSGFLITWVSIYQDGDSYGVYAQRFDNNGNKMGDEFLVNTETYSMQSNPKAVSIKDGFVIVWDSYAQDGDSYGIYAQRFDHTGVKTGSEFRINIETAGYQFYPAITSFNDGFIVCWYSGVTNTDKRICARIYDNSGNPLSQELMINQMTELGAVMNPQIAAIDNSAIVLWEDISGEDNSYDIFSRKLEIINSPGGPNLCARLVPPSDTVFTDRNLPVKGIVSDRNIARYTLELIDGSNTLTPLESVTEKNINGDLHLLDISLLTPDQPYTVMLKATDKAGNTATDSFTVIRMESESFITAYSTGNRYCSLSNPPEITFNLPDTADITLQITTTDYFLEKEILLGNFSAGSHTAVIDITNLPDGTYYFKLNATNSVTTFDSSIIVTIDNTQPAISLGSLPAFFNARAASSIALTATAEDSNLSLIELSIVDDNQNPVTTILSATNPAELKNAGFNPQLLPEAEYSLQLAVRDLAGNSSTASQLFTVDRTPPLFQHISPDFNAPLSGLVEIAAAITDTGAIQSSQVSLVYPDNNAEVLHAAAGNYLSFIWDTNQPFPDEAGEVVLLFMATDLAGNTLTESKPVVMDNHAPGIEISFKTALVTNNTNFFTNAANEIYLTSEPGDAYSRIQNTYYSINEANWNVYTAPLKFTAEGNYHLRACSVDNHGNTSPVNAIDFIVDNTPPGFLYEINDPKYANGTEIFVPFNNNITLASTGETGELASGVRELQYKVSGGVYETYEPGTGVRVYYDGPGEFFIKVTDLAGNTYEESIGTVFMDLAPPSTRLEAGCAVYTSYQRNLLILSEPSQVTFSAEDLAEAGTGSGVAATYYSLNDSDEFLYQQPVSIEQGAVYSFYYYSVDNVGNVENHTTMQLAVDTTLPRVDITASPTGWQIIDTLYVQDESGIMISATDNFAGVQEIYYSTDGVNYTAVNAGISFGDLTDFTLHGYAVDYIGLQSDPASGHIIVDTTAPVTTWTGNLPVTGAGNTYTAYTSTTLNWTTAEAGSGVSSTSIRVNDTELPAGSSTYTFPSPGQYLIEYASSDNLGNKEADNLAIFQVVRPPAGDVNLNGIIDIIDALMAAQYYSGLNPPGFCPAAGDVDGNGTVDIIDALLINNYYIGIITAFPVDIPESVFLPLSGGTGGAEYGSAVTLSDDGCTAAVGVVENLTGGAGSLYLYRWQDANWQETEIFSGYIEPGDAFGYAVSISGDGNTVAAGAPDWYAANSSPGAVHVFRWDGSSWQETELTAGDSPNNHKLGAALAVSDDGNTIVAGAPLDNTEGENAGALYIFTWNGQAWARTKITAGADSIGSQLGTAVAISDDGHTVVAGAPCTNNYGENMGTVYIFEYNCAAWRTATTFKMSGGQPRLGFSVAVNASGNIVAAGAPYDDQTGEDSGALFVYKKMETTWTTEKIESSSGLNYTHLGYAVSMDDSGNLLIAAEPGDIDNSSQPGSIRVFKWKGTTWSEDGLTALDGTVSGRFGCAAVVSGQGNNVIAGALGADPAGGNSGAAYIFKWYINTWQQPVQ